MGRMRTAVVSDLHLGGLADADVARKEKPLATRDVPAETAPTETATDAEPEPEAEAEVVAH